MHTIIKRPIGHKQIALFRGCSSTMALLIFTITLQAQDGKAGIQQATSLITGYFDVGITLMYVIGAVVGIVGAIKVYNAWSHGDQQTNKLAASWFGACIFLVVVAACLKSFFGVQ